MISSNFPLDIGLRHSQYGAVQVNILLPGEFRVKTRPDLQQCPDRSVNLGIAFGRLGGLGKKL
jgi:hypothetical protein